LLQETEGTDEILHHMGGSYTINPISAGVPDGSYDIYVTNPCTGLLVKCGTLKVRNC